MITKEPYHHGDLRRSLLSGVISVIERDGIDGLSIRKLADELGVSRTAPYHHFKNKTELLNAVAADGFRRWHQQFEAVYSDESLSISDRFRRFVYDYLQFAVANPHLYELMFGSIWKGNHTQLLKETAYPVFRFQLEMVRCWQQKGVLGAEEQPLRLAQMIWCTLHGMAKLLNDGVYIHRPRSEEAGLLKTMCECVIRQYLQE